MLRSSLRVSTFSLCIFDLLALTQLFPLYPSSFPSLYDLCHLFFPCLYCCAQSFARLLLPTALFDTLPITSSTFCRDSLCFFTLSHSLSFHPVITTSLPPINPFTHLILHWFLFMPLYSVSSASCLRVKPFYRLTVLLLCLVLPLHPPTKHTLLPRLSLSYTHYIFFFPSSTRRRSLCA